jgi:hypothetical protein
MSFPEASCGGQFLASIGMFAAGGYGASRKNPAPIGGRRRHRRHGGAQDQ